MKQYVIGLDNGGTSVKGAMYDQKGQQICVAQRKLSVITEKAGYMERDLHALWESNVACLRELMEQSHVSPAMVKAMSFSGHGKGLYLLDKAGRPLGNGITSMDQRAYEIVEEWNQDGTSENVFRITGQKVQYMQPVALLRWLKLYERERYDQIGSVLAVKDYIRYCLCGRLHGEYTDFSGSNFIDIKTGEYSREVLSLLGIEEIYEALPPLVHSSDICGYLSLQVALDTKLKQHMPLCAGMFDVDACSIGCGLCKPEQFTMIAGTWSINVYLSEARIPDSHIMFQSFYALLPYTLIEESSPTSSGNLEWLMKELFDMDDYAACNAYVESVDVQVDGVLYLPFLYGSNVGNIHGAFLNMQAFHTRADMIRAVYEGVAFAHKTHLLRLLKYRSVPKAIRIAGGIIHSPIWLQIFADVLQLPLEVVEHEEFGTQGAAICACVGTGLYQSFESAIEHIVHIHKTILPNPAKKAVYEQKYKRYMMMCAAIAKGSDQGV